MRAGPLRHRCRVQEAVSQKGPGGSLLQTWTDISSVWADISIPTGRTEAVSDRLQAEVTAEIQTRYRATIVAGMRIVHGPRAYLIEAVLPDNKLTMLRLLCSNVINP